MQYRYLVAQISSQEDLPAYIPGTVGDISLQRRSLFTNFPRDNLFHKMPGLDRGASDPPQYTGKKKPIPKVGKGSGILDENGVSLEIAMNPPVVDIY